MKQEDTLVVRESRTTVVIALSVCAILLCIGFISIGGPFHFAATVFMTLLAFVMVFVLWSATSVTVITSTGLHGRSFGKRWNYLWGEVESWGLKYDPHGEFSIWFTTKKTKRRHFIQALGEDIRVEVRGRFKRHCGDPQISE